MGRSRVYCTPPANANRQHNTAAARSIPPGVPRGPRGRVRSPLQSTRREHAHQPSLLAVAGTASAGTTAAKAPTTLSIVAAKSTITVGQWDTIGGTLASGTKPVVHRIVQLDVFCPKDKKWHAVEEKYTGKYGKVAFSVRPASTSAYELVFKGGSIYKASHSGVVVVRVKPFVKTATTLSIAESATTVTAGSTDTISGVLTITKDSKALPGQWVWLAVVVSGKAHAVKAFKTGVGACWRDGVRRGGVRRGPRPR
jgi:hypothetical protein